MVATLGGLLVLTAAAMLSERFLRRAATHGLAEAPHATDRSHPRATVLVGVGLGVAVTLTSVGAGALGTVALLFLFPRLATDRLVGTDIAHAVPLTLLAGLGHASLGHLDMALLGALLTGSVPAVLLASRVALRLPQRLLRVLLAVMLLIVGSKILWVR